MDPFVTLREMWREARKRRVLVALTLAISILIGLFVAYRPGVPPESRQYTVWLASADILVDTADSQVVDAKGADFLSLASRTSLLGNLIATEPLKTAIAKAAGIEADRLVVIPPSTTTTTGGVPLTPTPVTTVASRQVPDSAATRLTVSTDATLPILRVSAQAPDASTASGLTAGTLAQLERYLKTVGASEEIPAARKLVLRQLAAPTPAPETRGTPRLLGLLVAIMVALLGCGAIVTAPRLARRWRNAESVASRPDAPAAPDAPGADLDVDIGNAPFDRVAENGHARSGSPAAGERVRVRDG